MTSLDFHMKSRMYHAVMKAFEWKSSCDSNTWNSWKQRFYILKDIGNIATNDYYIAVFVCSIRLFGFVFDSLSIYVTDFWFCVWIYVPLGMIRQSRYCRQPFNLWSLIWVNCPIFGLHFYSDIFQNVIASDVCFRMLTLQTSKFSVKWACWAGTPLERSPLTTTSKFISR